MEYKNYITSFCAIRNGNVNVNHSITFSDQESASADFLKAVYKHYQMNYPKFYKMDNLSKLAFITSELLIKNNPVSERFPAGDIAIVVANSASSLEIDTEHQKTISDRENYFPSPAVFVYTLPNILIGEIAIRNGIKGENTFFIFDKFDPEFMSSYINSLLNSGKAQCCITGWVDFYEGKYESALYMVERAAGTLSIEHTKDKLEELISKHLN
ncbi:MAG: 3-oxoacyl-ACP synthase [Bacteroidota bacterium]|nr:3-oxoacyl-ACP synthase [Bacteroidota bacterium]